ncbi:MAG: hypothetical protein IJS95_01280 [Prevotella sp.]|nr:hypothetical protein [Prevotella sp.]
MNKSQIISSFVLTAIVCFSIFSCFSCSKDNEAPVIEGVWRNMTSEPVTQVTYAYPGQTLCLRGSGFGGLKKIVVNDSEIDVMNTLIYDTDNSITFMLPADVNTSTEAGRYYIKVIASGGECVYQPFRVKLSQEKPAISSFSSTILVSGGRLTITGKNLKGATDVFLPVAYDEKVRCDFDPEMTNTDTEVYVIVPEGVRFAKGQVEIVMQKTDDIVAQPYEERVYSSVTNFQ